MQNNKIVIIAILLVVSACMMYPIRFEIWADSSLNSPQFYLGYGVILILSIILVIDFIIINGKKRGLL